MSLLLLLPRRSPGNEGETSLRLGEKRKQHRQQKACGALGGNCRLFFLLHHFFSTFPLRLLVLVVRRSNKEQHNKHNKHNNTHNKTHNNTHNNTQNNNNISARLFRDDGALLRISPCSFRGGSDSASRSFEVELEVELEVEKVKCRTPLYPHPLSPPSTHFALIYLSTISHTENTATSTPLHLSIHQSCAPMKEKGFRLAQSNGQKNGFATGISHWKRKASSTEQTLAFPSRAKSFEQRRLHRCCLLCALHAGACFRLGATTTTIWRFSSAADPQTIYFFLSPHSLFRS